MDSVIILDASTKIVVSYFKMTLEIIQGYMYLPPGNQKR